MDLDVGLVVKNPRAPVADPSLLDPRAAAVLKGVVRSELLPFFGRLAEEGLWDAKVRFADLDSDQRATVLHGFWIRPGHGTFLKKGRDIDGSEVNHWLRWDGLFSAVEAQLERSKDAKWRASVSASRKAVPCPLCEGTGLGTAAELLMLGKRSRRGWEREGRLDAFLTALEQLPLDRPRAKLHRQRVLESLEALRKADPPLNRDLDPEAAQEVVERVVRIFTGMPTVAG